VKGPSPKGTVPLPLCNPQGHSPSGTVPLGLSQGLSQKGTVPSPKSQRGYLLITVVVALFLIATIAVLLTEGSAINANTASTELEAARAEYVAQAGMKHALWRAGNNACMGDVTIPATTLGNDTYTATITGAAAGTFYTLTADQDAWIRDDQPTTNKGGDSSLHIKDSQVEQPLYRFDLSSLPAGAQINYAVASFHVSGEHPEGPVTVHRITAGWNEGDVTWDSISGNVDSGILAAIPAQPENDVRVQVNITGQVQAWVNGEPNNGILLASTAPGIHAQYVSREGAAGEHPRLEVVVGSGPASPVTIKATGTLDNGVVRDLKDRLAGAYQPPAIHTISPGPADGYDAYIWEANQNTRYGTDDETWVSLANNSTSRSLLAFNLAGVPAGSRILSATLSLHHESGNNADVPITAHRISKRWDEAFVTWIRRDEFNNWDTAGGDLEPAVISTTSVGPASNIRYEWDIASLVQDWIDGAPNYGLALATARSNSIGERFYTSDETDPTLRPKLTITYACECGSACMAPRGSGNVLMVVDSTTSPWGEDIYKRDLLESWGYTVTMLADGHLQGTFDSAIAANDVILVSETIASTDLGTKLGNPAIGIVNTDGWMNDELGFESANSSNWPVGKSINITDTSHYITAPFVAGALDIYDADMGGLGIGGTAAPGLQPLADWSTGVGLATLDTGAMTAGGTTTAGRRVMLPFGRDPDLYWPKVNNNGHLILKRALDWGIGREASGTGNRLLFVVTDAASPVADEVERQTLVESWGYVVTRISDEDSQANYDAAVSVNDLAYISGDALYNNVGIKLADATIGVAYESFQLNNEFGLSPGGIALANLQSITIIDSSHYITSPYTGSVSVVTSNQRLSSVSSYAVDTQMRLLASIPSYDGAIATFDTGDVDHYGEIVAGRRVKLPWGDTDWGFDVNSLSADGQNILKRSLEWLAGADVEVGTTYAVLMVVSDPSSLNVPATDRKALMESWGYTVTLIDDDDSALNFTSAIDAADVVYIGSGTSLTSVLEKVLINITKGVVNEPTGHADTIGFASSWAVASGNQLTIVDSTHSITQGFASPLTVFTSSMTTLSLSGTLSPDLQNLAEAGAAPAIAVLESGAVRYDAGTTPGRRAQLPFSSTEGPDLTADGQLIVRRAIEWAAGAAETGPTAHWKLDDGTGTVAIDSEGGHDGTLANGPVWVAGQLGDALEFDGADDYVDLTSDAELDDLFDGGATVMAWINPFGWGENGYGRVFDKSSSASSTGDGWVIRMNVDNGGIINFGQGFTSGRGWWKIPSGSINLDTWQHIAVAYDASSTSNDPAIYLGGAPLTVTTVDTPSGSIRSDASINLRLGNFAGGTSHTFEGTIDDARIYDRILDAAQIAELAAMGGSGGGGGGGGGDTYLDEFGAVAYGGSDGALDWSGDAWEEVSESDGPSSGHLLVSADSVVPDGGNLRLVVDSRFTEVTRKVDLSAMSTAYLSFEYRREWYPTPSDYFAVHVSQNGSTWTELDRIYGIANDTVYRPVVYDISAYASANTTIAISTGGINNNQTLFVDKVRIGSSPPSGCAGTFGDEFNTRSYANNDGTLNWASDWTEIKESNGPTSGDIQIRNEINNYQLRVRDDSYGLWREADLSGSSVATLVLDHKRDGLDSSSDYVTVDISSDGGSSWTELDRFEGGGSDSLYQFRSYDISGHATANTRIRFLGSPSLGGQDEVWFDDIEIICSP